MDFISNVYWERISQFQLTEDTYPSWVLFAVTEGSFHYRIGKDQGIARFGDIVLCPPQTVFKRRVIETLSFHFFRFNWSDADNEPFISLAASCKLTVRDLNRLASNFDVLGRLNASSYRPSKPFEHVLRDIWYICVREIPPEHAYSSKPSDQMKKAAHLLQLHAFDRILLSDVAAEIGLTPVQFTRKFREVYGQTPIEYVTFLRLERAKALLLETDLTVDQIAQQCGYDNGFYLSRVFTKRLSMNPSTYRKENRI